ncbi:MAG: hypothetical protein E7419_02740 [Ruminococcaceae bacterium]|nr:hypothetical protein [Oscillospiraceae bacterium]
MEFLKKVNKISGILACVTTILTNFLLLSIGTGMIRLEFYYVTQVLVPCLISKIFLIIWCLYFAFGYEYDKSTRTFSKYLIPFIFVSIIVLIFDKEIAYYLLFQSVSTLLVLILISSIINQKRFALREKKYADKLYQLDVLIRICIVLVIILVGLSIQIAVESQSNEYNITLLVSTMVSQVFVIIGIFCVETAEKKFDQALKEGENPMMSIDENGELKNED